jgi:hypothetical protein
VAGHRIGRKLPAVEPPNAIGFGALTQLATDARAQETEHKIGTTWDGIDPKKSNNSNPQANFLFNFPLHGTPRRFVRVDLSAGKIPHIDVRPMAQQDARGVVEDDCKGANSVGACRH